MSPVHNQLVMLAQGAQKAGHRYLVRLVGNDDWKRDLLSDYLLREGIEQAVKLGGDQLVNSSHLGYKQGVQLLGQEIDCLIYDDCDGFDANSFTAATGALRAGGLCFLSLSFSQAASYQWLENALTQTVLIEEGNNQIAHLAKSTKVPVSPPSFSEQDNAIAQVKKVRSGHRKRPLVLTADRGRGKSAALGIAAAQLINESSVNIIVTAPSRKAVEPLFQHAKSNLTEPLCPTKNELVQGTGSLRFVSPDELIRLKPKCDIVFVDEASAIPVPMLESIVEHHHRAVFSSTIHGYEGCGRGFTLKFFKWLETNRPGWKHIHIHKPIRWNEGDPLETWIFETFLLNAEFATGITTFKASKVSLNSVAKGTLLSDPSLFKKCFALLVNAHYQTSPNDLLQILDDDSMQLLTCCVGDNLLGCMVVKDEGELSSEIVDDIAIGSRRPRGHLVPVTLSGQMGIRDAATQKSLRIMRIAVSPDNQNSSIGSQMLQGLERLFGDSYDYFSVSYGVTRPLLHFWSKNRYQPLRLGSSVDHTSGTHSLIMVKASETSAWVNQASVQFYRDLMMLLCETFGDVSAELVLALLKLAPKPDITLSSHQLQRIDCYLKGGSCYENMVFILNELLLRNLDNSLTDPVLVTKLLQRKSWKEVSSIYELSGKKQAEQYFKNKIEKLAQFTV